MKLYIIRHGETDWNKQGKLQGTTDIKLNSTGKEQARFIKQKLDTVNFNLCLTSPLLRAKETAKIICNKKCQIIEEPLLVERTIGNFEGKTSQEMDIDLRELWDLTKIYSLNGVEPLNKLLTRASTFLTKLKTNYQNYDTILIVSHGAFIKALYFVLNGYDTKTDFFTFLLKNCEIYEYELK